MTLEGPVNPARLSAEYHQI